MHVFLNYGDDKYAYHRRLGAVCARLFGRFDRVISADPSHIDPAFRAKHSAILNQPRGGGYWLWKPYIILKYLNTLQDGDILVYCDAGAFFTAPVSRILALMDLIPQDIYSFELPYIERQYTNRAVLDAMAPNNPQIAESNQVMSSFHFVRKSDFSINFYKTYLEYACNARLITDMGTDRPNEDKDFIDHRHDQSIHSILYKLNNLQPVGDATQWGGPIGAYLNRIPPNVRRGTAFQLPDGRVYRHKPTTPQMPEVLFLPRSKHPIRAYFRYRIKKAVHLAKMLLK